MLNARRISLALGAACISLSALAVPALAAGPATVTVRVEGLTETKLPPTQVTTTTESVVKDGKAEDSCPGTSALGALQLATGGNWGGPWEAKAKQYFINTIEGETHEYQAGASSNSYWSFWVNDRFEEEGACDVQLQSGDRVLLFPICYEGCSGPEPTPLEIQAPTSADVREPISVTVEQYNTKGEPSPALGAEVSSNGTTATTDSTGHATLSLSAPGTATLHVSGSKSGPPAVRTETTICVHNGNDGTCATQATSTGSTVSGSSASGGAAPPAPYRGPFALVARPLGLSDGHVYGPRSAPRLLAGTVSGHSAVVSVSLELRREYRGRCSAYDGTRERFVHARCGHGRFFKVASGGSYSYLLPAALAPGRYVLDVLATDAAGNRTAPARGSSRIVFYVR